MKRPLAFAIYVAAAALSIYLLAATLIPLTWSAIVGFAAAVFLIGVAALISSALGVPPRELLATVVGRTSR